MDIAIYVDKSAHLEKAKELVTTIGRLPDGTAVRVIDVPAAGNSLPAEVFRVMMKRRDGAFPLLLVDGEPALSGRLPTSHEIVSLLPEDPTRPALVTSADSAVQFGSVSRAHVSLNVKSIDVSLPFYKVLFGTEPTKIKPYYAKFEIEDPPMNFTLNERPFEELKEGPVGHFGIQAKDSERILEAKNRYLAAGFAVEEESQTACCYAVQTKIWLGDPDGNRWEVFITTDDQSNVFCPIDCLCYATMKPDQITPVVVEKSAEQST